jgi:hypothetical protein
MLIKNAAVLLTLLFTFPAWSLVEVRVTYSDVSTNPDKNSVYTGSGNMPALKPLTGIGGDLVLIAPVAGLGLGVRYENMALTAKGGNIKADGDATRTSLLLGWRLIDSVVYFGPVVTYGISHSGGNIKVTENNATVSDMTADKQNSYSAGAELGFKLVDIRVGAEAGYMNYIWKDLTGTTGSIQSASKLDMSGSYVKFTIGFGI